MGRVQSIVAGNQRILNRMKAAFVFAILFFALFQFSNGKKFKGKSSKSSSSSVITDLVKDVVESVGADFLSRWLSSPTGEVLFVNKCGKQVEIKTYDGGDELDWVAYATYTVADGDKVSITARGKNTIHCYVIDGDKKEMFTPNVDGAYAYDGNELVKIEEDTN